MKLITLCFVIAVTTIVAVSGAAMAQPTNDSLNPQSEELKISYVEIMQRVDLAGFLIHMLWVFSLVLGIVSINQATVNKNEEIPTSTYLLPFLGAISFLLGVCSYSANALKASITIERLGANVTASDYAVVQQHMHAPLLLGASVAITYLIFYILSVLRYRRSKKRNA